MENSINSTIERLQVDIEKNYNNIDELSNLIKVQLVNNKRVIIIGLGMTANVAKSSISELHRYMIDSSLFKVIVGTKTFDMDMYDAESLEDVQSAAVFELDSYNLKEEDLVIGVSVSGRTKYIKSAITYAKNIGCKVAVVSAYSSVGIADKSNSDVIIDTNTKYNNSIKIEYISGTTIVKSILDLVLINAMKKMGRVWKGIVVNTRIISKKIEESVIDWVVGEYDLSINDAISIINYFNKSMPHIITHLETKLSKDTIDREIELNDCNVGEIIEKYKK